MPVSRDRTLDRAVRRYVAPRHGSMGRYLWLLHGNLLELGEPERGRFVHSLGRAARQVTDDELELLLGGEWRSRLTAAYLIGVGARVRFRRRLEELLLAGATCFAGQGYCFALARFGGTADAAILMTFLDRYLPQTDLVEDQDWAMGALLHLDARLGTAHAAPYLGPDGLWEKSAVAERNPFEARELIDELCRVADTSMARFRRAGPLP